MMVTHTVRLDQCPPGLVHVPAHGDIPGGLATKLISGVVVALGPTWRVPWSIESDETPDFEGVPMTAVPTEVLDEIKRATSTGDRSAAADRAAAYMGERHS